MSDGADTSFAHGERCFVDPTQRATAPGEDPPRMGWLSLALQPLSR